jgi:hypothetical protein
MQDLKDQLEKLEQENSHLRTKVTTRNTVAEREHAEHPDLRSPIQEASRLPAPFINNFDHVRHNIRLHSRKIFDVPQAQTYPDPTNSPAHIPDIPKRSDFDGLAQSYFVTIHQLYPVIHWPTFEREVERVYTAKSFQGLPRDWLGLFFAILACGSLQASVDSHLSLGRREAGIQFFETSARLLVSWDQNASETYVRATFLLSMFATEGNKKIAGSRWLASSIRTAQEIGLNHEPNHLIRFEREMRRRLWWALYIRDR